MNKDEKYGFLNLKKKSLSVIAASIAILCHQESDASNVLPHNERGNSNVISLNKRALKPRLVLKLNMSNPISSRLAMHSSHASHSSHSSGYSGGGDASHASHALSLIHI